MKKTRITWKLVRPTASPSWILSPIVLHGSPRECARNEQPSLQMSINILLRNDLLFLNFILYSFSSAIRHVCVINEYTAFYANYGITIPKVFSVSKNRTKFREVTLPEQIDLLLGEKWLKMFIIDWKMSIVQPEKYDSFM